MRQAVIGISCAVVAFAGVPAGAPASPPAGAPASCVGVITSYEASQLPPGSVGGEVSGLATSAPGLAGAIVSPLAHQRNCA